MNYFLIYLFIGTLLYPAAMDMWYRTAYENEDFPPPNGGNWYAGFLLFVISWPYTFPTLGLKYIQDMMK